MKRPIKQFFHYYIYDMKLKKKLALSDREYVCECGNQMDRDVNAAVNIREEGKRLYKECA